MLSLSNVRTKERTYDVVVLAADGLSVARVAGAHSDDRDGAAANADGDVDTLNDNTNQGEQRSGRRVVGLSNASISGLQACV